MAIHLDSQQSFKKVGIQTKIIKVLGKNADHWFEVFIFEKRAMWYVVNEDGNPGFEPLKKQKVLSRIKHDKTLLLNIYIVKYRMWMLPTPEIYSSNPFILNGIMKYLKDEKRKRLWTAHLKINNSFRFKRKPRYLNYQRVPLSCWLRQRRHLRLDQNSYRFPWRSSFWLFLDISDFRSFVGNVFNVFYTSWRFVLNKLER